MAFQSAISKSAVAFGERKRGAKRTQWNPTGHKTVFPFILSTPAPNSILDIVNACPKCSEPFMYYTSPHRKSQPLSLELHHNHRHQRKKATNRVGESTEPLVLSSSPNSLSVLTERLSRNRLSTFRIRRIGLEEFLLLPSLLSGVL